MRRLFSPAIHILAGEKVCIQVIRPMHRSSTLASRMSRRMASALVITGLNTTVTGISERSLRLRATSLASASTCLNVSSPYRSWLPVTNQTSKSLKLRST